MRGSPLPIFAVVVLAAAAAAAATLAPRDSGSDKDLLPVEVRQAPLVVPAESHPTGPRRTLRTHDARRRGPPAEEDLAAGARPGRRALLEERRIERASEAFVAGLLRWEAGAAGASARRAIRIAATARLAAFVLSAPPRPPSGEDGIAHGRVDAVELLSRGADRALAQVTVSRAGARGSVVLLKLARRGKRWLAAALV